MFQMDGYIPDGRICTSTVSVSKSSDGEEPKHCEDNSHSNMDTATGERKLLSFVRGI